MVESHVNSNGVCLMRLHGFNTESNQYCNHVSDCSVHRAVRTNNSEMALPTEHVHAHTHTHTASMCVFCAWWMKEVSNEQGVHSTVLCVKAVTQSQTNLAILLCLDRQCYR